jgi:hypothetical protein
VPYVVSVNSFPRFSAMKFGKKAIKLRVPPKELSYLPLNISQESRPVETVKPAKSCSQLNAIAP